MIIFFKQLKFTSFSSIVGRHCSLGEPCCTSKRICRIGRSVSVFWHSHSILYWDKSSPHNGVSTYFFKIKIIHLYWKCIWPSSCIIIFSHWFLKISSCFYGYVIWIIEENLHFDKLLKKIDILLIFFPFYRKAAKNHRWP